jgi:GNAT superfamily N-acetyltransferase
MTLDKRRTAVGHLLAESNPADGMAAYFALHHPAAKTRLVSWPPDAPRASGYVALAMTGMDLLRPFVTWRLPPDIEQATQLIYQAIEPEMPLILHIPAADAPLVRALFAIESEQILRLYRLDAAHFTPTLNVLTMRAGGPNNLRRYAIWEAEGSERAAASAGLNWESPIFAEIAVNVLPGYRRRGLGRSVVSALAQDLLTSGHIPLYAAAETNEPSIELATRLGFTDTGARLALIEGSLRPQAVTGNW